MATQRTLAAMFCSLAATAPSQAPRQFDFYAPPGITPGSARYASADIDGDGDLDLVASGMLWRNDLPAGFTNLTATLPVQLSGHTLPFDCDGDGDVDLWNGFEGGPPSKLLRNNGSGQFTLAGTFQHPRATAAGDIDGDGDLDLLVGFSLTPMSPERILLNNGTGSFTPAPSLPTGAGLKLLDLEGDGDLDLLVGGSQLYRNDGNLVFTDVTATQVQFPYVSDVVVGDFDGDGDPDLVTDQNHIVLNQGGILVASGSLQLSWPPSSAFTVADVDQDGDLDLWRNVPDVSLWLNNGNATFVADSSRLPAQPIYSTSVHSADLDRDGDPELLISFSPNPPLMLRNRHVHIDAGPAQRGQTWNVSLLSQPGYATAVGAGVLGIALTRLPIPQVLPGAGLLWLLPGAMQVDTIYPPTGRTTFALAVPSAPELVGIELHAQGLIVQPNGTLQLTTLSTSVIQ